MARRSVLKKTVKTEKSPRCPECRSLSVVPILSGSLTPKQQSEVKKGLAVPADREEWEGMTEWYCKACGCDWSGKFRRFKKPRRS